LQGIHADAETPGIEILFILHKISALFKTYIFFLLILYYLPLIIFIIMRRLLLPLAILFITSCQKETRPDNLVTIDEVSPGVPLKKIDVCHNGHMISISQNAWPEHKAHGDLMGSCTTVPEIPGVSICNQIWMTKNLDVDHYTNGDPIPQVTDPAEWASLKTGAWCYFYNNTEYGAVYGKLYNWYAVNDPRGLSPVGWHIPTVNEWEALISCLGGEWVAGGKLKEAGTTHWLTPNTGATNESGFTALPANLRNPDGTFSVILPTPYFGITGDWWTKTEFNFNTSVYAYHKYIVFNDASVQNGGSDKHYGLSVRCVKD